MTHSKHRWQASILIGMCLPGPVAFLILKGLYWLEWSAPHKFADHSPALATLTATFAFTMLGFLAAVITILFGFGNRHAFRKYAADQRMKVLFGVYYLALIHLAFLFLVSVIALPAGSTWWLKTSVILAFNAAVQVTAITWILTRLVSHAITPGGGYDTTGRGPDAE